MDNHKLAPMPPAPLHFRQSPKTERGARGWLTALIQQRDSDLPLCLLMARKFARFLPSLSETCRFCNFW